MLLLHLFDHLLEIPSEAEMPDCPCPLLKVIVHLEVVTDRVFRQPVNHRHQIWHCSMHLREDTLISSHVILFKIHPQMVLVSRCKVLDHLNVDIEEICVCLSCKTLHVEVIDVEVEIERPW